MLQRQRIYPVFGCDRKMYFCTLPLISTFGHFLVKKYRPAAILYRRNVALNARTKSCREKGTFGQYYQRTESCFIPTPQGLAQVQKYYTLHYNIMLSLTTYYNYVYTHYDSFYLHIIVRNSNQLYPSLLPLYSVSEKCRCF